MVVTWLSHINMLYVRLCAICTECDEKNVDIVFRIVFRISFSIFMFKGLLK